jgi:hypothetical protein
MKPVFTEVAQIAIVVRDLDATLKRYVEDYGSGPWQIHQLKPGDSDDVREYGKRVDSSRRPSRTLHCHPERERARSELAAFVPMSS